MKRFIAGSLIALMAMSAFGCTGNNIAKNYGRSETIKLSPGERLDNVTWKDDDMWILKHVEPTKAPKTYTFKEKSSFGLMQGTITIIES